MKNLFKWFLGIVAALLIVPSVAQAQDLDQFLPDDQGVEAEESGEVLAAETVAESVPGPHFRFGEVVVISEDLEGDVYVAGGQVRIDGTINGDLMVAGGLVVINGSVTQDLRAGGGDVIINGSVGQNVTVAGGSVRFGHDSQVGGSIVAGGGNVSLDGAIVGNVWLGSGNAELAGQYDQDVNVDSETLSVIPGVVVGGSLHATTSEETLLPDDVVVEGDQNVAVRVEDEGRAARKQAKKERLGKALAAGSVMAVVMGMLMGIVGGSALLYAFPKFMVATAGSAKVKPMSKAVWGLFMMLLLPIVAVLLMVTVIGMPLGFMLLLGYVLTMMMAGWVVSLAIGAKVAERTKASWLKNKYAQVAAGVVILELIGLVPVLGWLVKLVAFLVGFGAIALWFKNSSKK